ALVQVATQDLGTGSYTVFSQVAADALGIPVERVTFELGDSDFPEAPGSGGSTTAATVSEAVVQAAQKARAQLDAQRDVAPGREIVAEAKVTPDDPQIKAHSLHSWGAQLCEVKIDPQLPRVQVTRWVSVVDVGRVLNRKLAKSQVLGGVTMG